mmetsp:Transcript_27919/g.63113  ORF Transcript_27919/g.63113 Transcript_27919/m.63113 type:complete len:306 (+) Transcript_27919:2179-3096(+)
MLGHRDLPLDNHVEMRPLRLLLDDCLPRLVGDLLECVHHAVALVLGERLEQLHFLKEGFVHGRLLRVGFQHDQLERDTVERPQHHIGARADRGCPRAIVHERELTKGVAGPESLDRLLIGGPIRSDVHVEFARIYDIEVVALLPLRNNVLARAHVMLAHHLLQHLYLGFVESREDDVPLNRAHDARERIRALRRALRYLARSLPPARERLARLTIAPAARPWHVVGPHRKVLRRCVLHEGVQRDELHEILFDEGVAPDGLATLLGHARHPFLLVRRPLQQLHLAKELEAAVLRLAGLRLDHTAIH